MQPYTIFRVVRTLDESTHPSNPLLRQMRVEFRPIGKRLTAETPEEALDKANQLFPTFKTHLAVEPAMKYTPGNQVAIVYTKEERKIFKAVEFQTVKQAVNWITPYLLDNYPFDILTAEYANTLNHV